jgi:hypothetical protein
MAEEKVAYHDLVKQIVDEMVPEEGGPVLPEDALIKWTSVLREHREAKTIAQHLVALGVRFLREKAVRTGRQLALLAVSAADADWVREALEQAGLPSGEAKKIVDEAGGVAAKTVDGLEPPKAGGPKRG